MGMTDKQFAAYNRHLWKRLKSLEKQLENIGKDEIKEELRDIMDDIQKTIEELGVTIYPTLRNSFIPCL